MAKYSLFDDEFDDEGGEVPQADQAWLYDIYCATALMNHLGCAPLEDLCCMHDEMLVTPDRCDEGAFETYVEADVGGDNARA